MKLSWVGVGAGVVLFAIGLRCATGLPVSGEDASTGGDGGDASSACPQFDLQTDPQHCGSCTNACTGDLVCSDGQCKAQCDPPLIKCLNTDGGGEAGVCFDLTSNIDHCGQCATECATGDAGALEAGNDNNPDAGIPTPDGGFPPGPYWSLGTPTCTKSMCGIQCPGTMTECSDSICYDTQNFHDHCGNCTTACADDTEWCTQGNCCPVGQGYCSGACTDLLSNASNCGACGVTCSGGTPVCSNGVCSSSIVYTDSFTNGVIATTQCTDWTTFRGKLTGTYTSITMKGSNDTTGRTCTGADANTLCQALHTNTLVGATSCGGYTWEVSTSCGSASPELSADGSMCTCETTGYDVRPCIDTDDNWGGINTATCGAPTQTMTVSCQ
jgi:hypothetical protein